MYTIPDALGWFGGIVFLICVVSHMVIQPFLANNLVISVCSETKAGKDLEIDSASFFWLKLLDDFIMCRFVKSCCLNKFRYVSQL